MASQEFSAPVQDIESLFHDFFTVPVYQRDYAWREEEAVQLLDDIGDYALDGEDYLLGKIITTRAADGTSFDLIDGQQRVTTLWLLMAALRVVGLERGLASEKVSGALFNYAMGPDGRDVQRLRLSAPYNSGDELLRAIAACEPGEAVEVGRDAPETQRNMTAVFTRFVEELRARLPTEDDYYEFIKTLNSRVRVIHVQAPSPNQALLLFETTNNRGRPLAASDLVKNVMFTHADESDYEHISSRWADMDAELRQARLDVTAFLRYVSLGRFGNKVSTTEVAGWFRDKMALGTMAKAPDSDPGRLMVELVRLARIVRYVRAGKSPQGATSAGCAELKTLNVKQALPVILTAADWSDQAVEVLARELADFFFVAAVIRLRGQDIERRIPTWVEVLRTLVDPTPEDVRSTLSDLASELPRSVAIANAGVFRETLGQMRYAPSKTRPTDDTRRLRYFLRHVAAHVQGDRWSKLAEIDGYNPQIEHVLAQTPPPAAVSEFGREPSPDDIHELGNLTPLEKELNEKVGNGTFSMKAPTYRSSRVQLTAMLVESDPSGLTLARQKALGAWARIAPGLPGTNPWTPEDCARRLALYQALATEIWLSP